MSQKVNKINNLKKIDGFLQINYSKGFKYVDKAGEFMNNLYKGEKIPRYAMDPTGMTVKFDEKTELKATHDQLWLHFTDPDSFDYERENFEKYTALVDSLFEPEKYTRIGWRHYFVYDSGTLYPKIISYDFLKEAEFNELVFSQKISNFNCRISISKLIKKEGDTKAILFDIDISNKEDIKRDDFNKITTILKDIESVYRSEDLLKIINGFLN